MSRAGLRRQVPDAGAHALAILDPARGSIEAPVRAEIFGAARFEQHGESLGAAHEARRRAPRSTAFFPRLRDNIAVLREAHHYIGLQEHTGHHVSPAGEWLLDNFHVVVGQLKEIHDGLPRRYFRDLPVLVEAHLAGLPRIYGVAWAFVAHTDSAFDEALLADFLGAYQRTRELTLGELWALPTTLRVVLIENLRRLAERVAASKAARELANLWCDRLPGRSEVDVAAMFDALQMRGVEPAFALQVLQRLRAPVPSERGLAPGVREALDAALARLLPDAAGAQSQQQAEQAANNLSVGNAITSLRLLGDTDWRGLLGRISVLMQRMQASPSFRNERDDTQDTTLQAIERLARRSGCSERVVAAALLELMAAPPEAGMPVAPTESPSHWLRGPGRARLRQALGLGPAWLPGWAGLRRRYAVPAYLGTMALGSLALAAWFVGRHAAPDASAVMLLVTALLALGPASEAVIAVVNRLISESVPPRRLPRLALAEGIPPEQRVLVVVPTLLTSAAGIAALAARLERHSLVNDEPHAQFALLSDFADAATREQGADAALLAAAVAAVDALEARHAAPPGTPRRFLLLHRERQWSDTEQRWIGWERKRGKLEQLIALLAVEGASPFIDLGARSRPAVGTPHLLTLDGDTVLPPGALRELVAVAAHPLNRPRIDPLRRRVVGGYGILQPQLVTPLPAPREVTPFHRLFAGQCGVDPYSAASSEVYQDLFDEASFSGKGLLNVAALHAVLAGRLPKGLVLSHDLVEGALARCGGVSDIALIEDAPMHADVAGARVHRWTRGDWQLLPLLLGPRRLALGAIDRWKMVDNLRRSLVAPSAVLLLLIGLAGGPVAPGAALALVAAAFGAGPLLGAVAGLAPSRDDLAVRHFFRLALAEVGRAAGAMLWQLAMLLQQALSLGDAIVRAVWRMTVSRRRLLQWTPAAATEALVCRDLAGLARRHARTTVLAMALLAGLLASGTPHAALAVALCALWAAAPLWTWWASRPQRAPVEAPLRAADHDYLLGVARDTWRLFERHVGPETNDLPPDNVQTLPTTLVAQRTSPTNIGLYLLATACARQFGWIGTEELLARCERTLATLARLPRHRGHFLNWYDTQTLASLPPDYVSTVDSGNLCGHLLALASACEEGLAAPLDPARARAALAVSAARTAAAQALTRDAALRPALAELLAWRDPLQALRDDAVGFDALLRRVDDELAPPGASAGPPSAREQLDDLVRDHLAALRSAALDAAADAGMATGRLAALAAACRWLAQEAEFGFLFDARRRLFHIGYRVAEQQLDKSFYDLLASEARLASLWAIAKGDVPVSHWAALGRPFYAIGGDAGLRSWSGSMFEYLMPSLVLDEPPASALASAARAAVHEQMAHARTLAVPWGMSESAYAASDHTLAYQYAPQGVPRLALRRTPAGEVVVAPYASALAAMFEPRAAADNLRRLEGLQARAALGFVEALDFSAERQTSGSRYTPVSTFMAHHQGMTIVALAQLLLGAPRRWGGADARLGAVASLLHERVPREVARLLEPPPAPSRADRRDVLPGASRELVPGETALQPTHLLSNGRYSVALRANGAGWSRYEGADVSRWRDDALRDAHGSFVFLRRAPAAAPVSITQHPAPDPQAHYRAIFHSDRVHLDAQWSGLRTRCTVWVSPEDDIELRQIEVWNEGGQPVEIELMSMFEVSLSEARADEMHPAFANLFVRAEWNARDHALFFAREPRGAHDVALHAVHFIAQADAHLDRVRAQTDRAQWLGRHREAAHPRARFEAVADSPSPMATQTTGLDPVAALSMRLRVPAGGTAQLTLATAAARDRTALDTLVDRYRQAVIVERSSLMSATFASIRLREMRFNAEARAAIQTLTTAVALLLARPALPALDAGCDRRALWRFGVSGDRPIVVVAVGALHGLRLVRSLAQALRWWSWGGLPCDLVVLSSEPHSYLMPAQTELVALRDRQAAEAAAQPRSGRLLLLQAHELSLAERGTLLRLARAWLDADGRPLAHHVQELVDWHDADLEARLEQPVTVLPAPAGRGVERTPQGDFDGATGDFRFEVEGNRRPPRPWINVLANPGFGAQVSEAGAGYTWAGNSRLHQLTPWSNDPLRDSDGETFYLQDLRTRELWSVGAGCGAADTGYAIEHGQGVTTIRHRHGALEVRASWCVDATLAVKQLRIRLHNTGPRTLRLRVIGVLEWMMGALRADRQSLRTAREALPAAATEPHRADALFATQLDGHAGFGGSTAFLALHVASAPDATLDAWTCDRRELFDARGAHVVPDHFGERAGLGLDPCAAAATTLALGAGESEDCVFLIGHGDSMEAARLLARSALGEDAAARERAVRERWAGQLGALVVRTPDPRFDALVNHWLLYQTLACRLWARAGFYQAGGAFGFRDQLQDAMALAVTAPALLRRQLLLAASRQFVEGDVQHWWHAPLGAGVRTRFSDDLLWLPHAALHYVEVTGDAAVLDESVPFLDGQAVPPGAEDAYFVPTVSAQAATLYEHGARTLDRSLAVGAHGLPLMGSGDWNDGMNRVGAGGQGESVWLAWFLCLAVRGYAPLARERGEAARAVRWEAAARGWRNALRGAAWDGEWYARAFFDDGSPLGSHANAECRIDLIAQAWSVLSGVATPARQRTAMASVERLLVDEAGGLIRLLDPPLARARPSAGYIQAYPPGVRENGGQYNHAGVWALMAQAALGDADGAWRSFTRLSPAHRSADPAQGPVYGLEPYVMAGDVYTQPPYVGRGGWSWYTGSAAWMHRAAVESICGLQVRGGSVRLQPRLPSHWPRVALSLRRDGRTHQLIVCAAWAEADIARARASGAGLLTQGDWLSLAEAGDASCHLVIATGSVEQGAVSAAAA